jgi:hypothetical protein
MNDGIPDVCRNFRNLEWDYDEFRDVTMHYCLKNVWLPVRKESCAKANHLTARPKEGVWK